MNQDFKYSEKMLTSCINEIFNGNKKICFFNTSTPNTMYTLMKNIIDNKNKNMQVFKQVLLLEEFQEPYFPFLKFIKDFFYRKSKKEVEKFIKEAGVYYFHQSIFVNYIIYGISKRDEPIAIIENMESEITYEKEQILESILNILKKISEEVPILFFIQNLHFAKESTIRLIEHMLNKTNIPSLTFIFSFNTNYKSFNNKENNIFWGNFLDTINDKIISINFYTLEDNDSVATIERKQTLNELLNLSVNCFNFLALQEAKNYITKLYIKLENEYIQVSENTYIKILNLIGDIFNVSGEIENALLYYDILMNHVQKVYDKENISIACSKIAHCYHQKIDDDSTLKFVKQSIKMALEVENDFLLIQPYILLFFLSPKLENNIENIDCITKELIVLLKKYKLFNQITIVYSNLSYLMNITYKESLEKSLEVANTSIKLCEHYKNYYRLSMIYHVTGMLYQSREIRKEALFYYKKSEEIRKILKNNEELVKVYNGTGYYYFTDGEYMQAHDYYINALELLKDLNDYNEICGTFYNIALNYFYTYHYKDSYKLLENALKIMNILKIESLFFKPRLKIYSICAICYLKCDKFIKSFQYLSMAKELAESSKDEEALAYFELLNALIFKYENKYSLSAISFDKAIAHIKDILEFRYILILCLYEYGLMLNEMGNSELAKVRFEEGLNYCKTCNLSFYESLILKELNLEHNNVDTCFNPITFNIKYITESAKQQLSLNKLQKKVNEVNFLNNIQNILSNSYERVSVIHDIMSYINNNFLVEASFIFVKENNLWKCTYSTIPNSEFELKFDTFIDILMEPKKERLIKVVSNEPELKCLNIDKYFNSIISIPLLLSNKGEWCILYATKNKDLILCDDDLKTLSIASKQLATSIERIDLIQNQKSQLNYIKMTKQILEQTLDKLNLKTSALQNLLNNAGQGFLMFKEDLIVMNEYSLECKRIFGYDITKRNFAEIIFSNSPSEMCYLAELLDAIFNEQDNKKTKLLLPLLPDSSIINNKFVHIDYKFIDSSYFMVILTDVTSEKTLETQMECERNTLKMVVKIVIEKSQFIETINEYKTFCENTIYQIIEVNSPIAEILNEIFRIIHTFKGTFSQLNMLNIVQKLHAFESEIYKIKNNLQNYNLIDIKKFFYKAELYKWLEDDLCTLKDILGDDFFDEDNITIEKSKFLDLEEKIKGIIPKKYLEPIIKELEFFKYRSLKEMLKSYPDYVLSLSINLNKLILPFEIEGDDIMVDPYKYNKFTKSLIHIFRNMIDHGIELPHQRIALNKDEHGSIKCSVKKISTNQILITICDDGKGIDMQSVKEKALKSGIINKNDKMSTEDFLKIIFYDNFSTSEKITTISGRGMGLSAIKKETELLGGYINVTTKKDIGTKFEFYIPV